MYFDLRLWRMTQGQRGRMALGVGFGLLALGVGISRFAFLGIFLARVFAGAAWTELIAPLLAAGAAVLVRACLDHARTRTAHRTAAVLQAQLRARLLDKVAALGPAWFGAERTGGVMLSMIDGVEQLQTFFGQYLPQLCVAAVAPVVIFIFIAWWDVPVALVLLGAALFTLTLPLALHRRDRVASQARQKSFKAFGEEFLDGIQGLPTLKAFGQSGAYGRMLAEKARALSSSTLWVLAMSIITRGITDVGIALGAAAALALGAWRVRHGQMSLEALLVVLMAGTEIFRPLRDLRGVLHNGMAGQSAAAGIHALLDEPVFSPAAPAHPVTVELMPTMAFENVGFSYPGGRRAAHVGLTFAVAAGERVGIVGPSGSGKSSIVRLLLRLHDPQTGMVRVGGQDISCLDPEALRRMIAVVAQDTYLFHGTVEENLRLGRVDATAEELITATQAANAHEFISALPDGYATLIGERGALLSGGQRQRIAIARALLRNAPILVLDEALSAVDAENEAVIQQALDRLMQGRTTIILAHRLSSVIGADQIFVLNAGVVVQTGRHDALIAVSGPYRDLMGPQLQTMRAPEQILVGALLGAAASVPDAAPRALAVDAEDIGWRKIFLTLLKFIRPWRRDLILTVMCGVGRVLAFIGVGVLGALIVGTVKAGEFDVALVIALLVVAPLAGLLHWLESWKAHAMAYELLAEMRINLFTKLDRLAPAYLLRRRAGDLVALATQDVETVEYFYAHTVAPACVAVLVPVSVLLALGWMAWPLAIVLLPFLVYAAASPVLGRARIDRMGSAARAALGALNAYVAETIQGLAELFAFQAIGRRQAEFVTLTSHYQTVRLGLLDDLSRQSAGLEIATGLGGLAVAAMGAWLVAAGLIAAEMLPLLVLISVAAFFPVSEIAQVGRQLADTIAATRRLHVVHAEPDVIRDGNTTPTAPRGGSAMAFEQVDFTYPGRAVRALKNFSCLIAPGSTVALVGPSGAGKTTVANLLLRFWDPDAGRITLDGEDLQALTMDGLRSRIALVAQDTYLFNDTLEKNVLLARPDAHSDEVLLALRRAALEEFVNELPLGLLTRVGERGVQLSGGQRQRVAIARAFLKDASILVLDEATSHLDTISEQMVRRALDALMTNRTTIVVAHRLSTIQAADLILVMQAGQVVESGTHDTLIAGGGFYARLIDHQASS
ncbi:MAG: ABC transporter ATP-binding protein [Acetobacteraceae bacterium]|nr:ABC transporter ATP-binding protein [Acetobacteraceae bacterium]MSP29341.1 ABC transporter ATP-binding protein [Acetobacteraceae bacterium]